MKIPHITEFTDGKHTLTATGTWGKSVHVFDERSAQAIRAALAAGRPLLVRGEPGTGKSQLARAAAKVLKRKFLSEVVNAHTEIQDLWYRFDAVSRLGNAQVLSTLTEGDKDSIKAELEPCQYLSPGILWWAFDWKGAASHDCKYPLFTPDPKDTGNEEIGVVLLLDEIDKADADLPNSLLETLDNGKFSVPWLQRTVGVDMDEKIPKPLVVITTNEDRQLPGAFMRRCMVLDLRLPKDTQELVQHLMERGKQHFTQNNGQSLFDDKVLEEAARQLDSDRQQANKLGVTPPGQAEYLDMLRVLAELADGNVQHQLDLLDAIKDFALKKHPGMQKNIKSSKDGQ